MKQMNKLMLSTLALAVTSGAHAANSFDEAMKNATTSGQFRFGYVSVSPDVAGAADTSGAAVGGYIKLETAEWNRLQFAIAPYFSEKVDSLSGDAATNELDISMFDANGDSYAYLGEAYVNYTFNSGSVRLGRQQLDNPFINTDDIRMSPNTFNALWANAEISKNLSVEAGSVKSWAGIDSGDDKDTFKRASNDGVTAIGATYKMKDHHTFQGWYYNFDQNYSLLYLDAHYLNGAFEAGLQYADFSEDNASGIDGNAWGISAAYSMGDLSLSIAMNEASNDPGKAVDLGLGGGNFFASMDENVIAGLTNASAYVIGVGYAISADFNLDVAIGHFEDGTAAAADIDETNVILGYNVNDKTTVEFTHTMVENAAAPADAGTNFSRQFLRVNYNF